MKCQPAGKPRVALPLRGLGRFGSAQNLIRLVGRSFWSRYVRAARRPASTKRACSHPACTKPACTEIITDTDCPARLHREARCIGWQRGGDALRISPGFSIADKRSSRTNTDGFPHSAVSAGKCAGSACHWPRSLKSQVSPASPRAVAWPSSSKRLIAAAPRGPARDAGVAHRC